MIDVYEKPKGGIGMGESTGYNMKNLAAGAGIIGVGTVFFKYLD